MNEPKIWKEFRRKWYHALPEILSKTDDNLKQITRVINKSISLALL